MEVAGVAVAFGSIMYLITKRVSMGLALLIGTGIAGLLTGIGLQKFVAAVVHGIFSTMTIELVIAVALISGLGKLMRENGDLKLTIDSLVAVFRSPKVLSIMLPALIGTINVPGGAIMSAPMVEENGKVLGFDATTKAAVNLFSRHIGYFVYPLYASTIILSELLGVEKLALIRHNAITMLVGFIIAYPLFFRGVDHHEIARKNSNSAICNMKNFLLGFSPIIVALGLVLAFQLPFYVAIAIGVVLALGRGLSADSRGNALRFRMRTMFIEWIDYKLVLVMVGLMAFKAVLEASGVIDVFAATLFAYGVPLPMMVVVLGLLAGYLTGSHTAAAGILAALFVPLFPDAHAAPYTSLLFTAIMAGYLTSPIHLCFILTNQYFGAKYGPVSRRLFLPVLAMLLIAVVQLLVTIR